MSEEEETEDQPEEPEEKKQTSIDEEETKRQPHDSVVKLSLSERRVALELFDKYMDSEVKELVDQENYIPINRTFVDEDLRQTAADVLFAFPRKDKKGHIYAYKLVEHASTVPRFQAFRLKRYEMAIMDYDIRNFKSKWLPLVCSTVLHNGKTLFKGARTILDLMDVPSKVAKKYWNDPFHLVEYSSVEDEELRRHQWLGALEYALKHIYDPDLKKTLVTLVQWLGQLPSDPDANIFIKGLLTYLFLKGNTKELQKTLTIEVESLEDTRIKEQAMTIAEMLREEGAKKTTEKHALGMLIGGVSMDLIMQITGLSEAEIRTIEALRETEQLS